MAWAETAGLTFCPLKTVAVIFTRIDKKGKKFTQPPNIIINGIEVEYEKEVKYLRVIFDCQLTFSSHIKEKLVKSRKLLMARARIMGRTFSPRPLCMKWMYECVARPAFVYDCFIWGQTIKDHFRTDLIRIQSRALRLFGNFHRGTPNEALNVFTDTIPLDLYIEGLIVQCYLALENQLDIDWDGLPIEKNASKVGHV